MARLTNVQDTLEELGLSSGPGSTNVSPGGSDGEGGSVPEPVQPPRVTSDIHHAPQHTAEGGRAAPAEEEASPSSSLEERKSESSCGNRSAGTSAKSFVTSSSSSSIASEGGATNADAESTEMGELGGKEEGSSTTMATRPPSRPLPTITQVQPPDQGESSSTDNDPPRGRNQSQCTSKTHGAAVPPSLSVPLVSATPSRGMAPDSAAMIAPPPTSTPPVTADPIPSSTIDPNIKVIAPKKSQFLPPTPTNSMPPAPHINIPPAVVVSHAYSSVMASPAAAPSSSVPPSAAAASVTTTPPSSSKLSPNAPLRRGKWTVEEEAYVARVIQDFNSGYLNAPAGTTLRSYLSEKLHCDPMRITKKFTGDSCIGKRVFHPAVRCASNASSIDKAQAELDALEQRWRRRLEMQQRDSAKKAAASAAAAAAAATGRSMSHLAPAGVQGGVPNTAASPHHVAVAGGQQHHQHQHRIKPHNVVARTASWLDRATAVLGAAAEGGGGGNPTNYQIAGEGALHPPPPGRLTAAAALDPSQEIEAQMNEVRRLIHEGPIIQQTTAGLPHLLHHNHAATSRESRLSSPSSSSSMRKVSDDQPHLHTTTTNEAASYATSHPYNIQSEGSNMFHTYDEPSDKKARRSNSPPASTTTGAEDAEALVGFLNSVRASAAAAEGQRSG